MKRIVWIAAVILTAGTGQGYAQEEDGPGRGVARLSLIAGDVSVRRGDTGEWVAAAVNGPLVAGDNVLSGSGSRAEIQFDWANMLRLSANTEARLTELENNRYQVQLASGTAMFAVIRESAADVDISTPSISIRPVRKGLYRVTVRPGEAAGTTVTEVSVRSGEVEIFSPRGSERLGQGKSVLVRGSLSDPEFQNIRNIPEDDWDRWNDRRNRELSQSVSYNYVSRDIYGADDLDSHGSWITVAPYGRVWAPRVAVGWAPYRYGRWSWTDYYGWTWLSYDPWGWAPYHYGRWFYHTNRWCWWPGGIGARHWWRPALVGWVGWGSGGFGVGVGIGGVWGWGRVGWIPLAPYETFYPWYGRRWYGRGGNTTIINNVNITNIYKNSRVTNGATVVQADRFGRGDAQHLNVSRGELERVASARGPLPMVPDRSATRWTNREANVVRSASAAPQQFYSRREAASVERVSFDRQRQGMEQISRAAFGERPSTAVAGRAPAERSPSSGGTSNGTIGRETIGVDRRASASESRTAAIEGGRGRTDGAARRVGEPGSGWRRVGDPTTSTQESRSFDAGRGRSSFESGSGPDGTADRSGWRRFGEPRQDRSTARDGAREGRAPSSTGADTSWRHVGEASRSTRDSRGWSGFGNTRERAIQSGSSGDFGSRTRDRGGFTGGESRGTISSPRMERSPSFGGASGGIGRSGAGMSSGARGGGPSIDRGVGGGSSSSGGGSIGRGSAGMGSVGRGSAPSGGGSVGRGGAGGGSVGRSGGSGGGGRGR